MKSKFYIEDKRTLKQKLTDFGCSMLFWRGRKKGMIHTRNITWDDIRAVFFPKNFYEKYHYLGSVPYNELGDTFEAMEPLVIFIDYKAKPWWCPRWFLRFLHVFGSDKSIVRVRNWTLHDLLRKITKGIAFVDWKTKWEDYDLRISIHAPEHLQNLADDIEHGFYSRGKQKELVEQIKALDPNASIIWGSTDRLQKQLDELEDSKEDQKLNFGDNKDMD